MDLGNCPVSDKPLEAYCPELGDMVCSQCAMFGRAAGKRVLPPEKALELLKDRLNDSIKKGTLRSEFT